MPRASMKKVINVNMMLLTKTALQWGYRYYEEQIQDVLYANAI